MSIGSAIPYDAEAYDLFCPASVSGDIEWYRDQAVACGGPVLELGAGTGRTLLPVAKAGVEIDGLELDSGMLARLEQKVQSMGDGVRRRVGLHQGDMRDFSLHRQYALIQIPFRAFLHNVTREDQLATLRCCHRHLLPGARLAMNAFHPSLTFMAASSGSFQGVSRLSGSVRSPDGGMIVLYEAQRYDTPRQHVHSILRYEFFDPEGNLTRTKILPLHLAYLYPGDYRDILTEAGFVDIEIYGGFDESRLDRDGDELVVVARRSQ